MSPNNFDIPSVIRIPDSLDGITEFVRTQIVDKNPSVIILDLEQGTAVVQTDRQDSPKLNKDSLPFLLSNHTLEMSESKTTMIECIEAARDVKDNSLLCLFMNPVHENLELGEDIYYSSIITEYAVVGYYEDKDKNKTLRLTTIGG